MSRSAARLLAVFLVATQPWARADSYLPFTNFRIADPTGKYYLVVKQNGGEADPGRGTPVTFELAERRRGSPPVVEARDELDRGEANVRNPEVKVREGDAILGKGSLARCPSEILISSTGMGFVGLDVRGYNYGSLRSGDAVVVVTRDGTVRHRKNLIDLFSEREIAGFDRTAGGVCWCGGGWIDEARKQVIVVGSGTGWENPRPPSLFRVVDIDNATVRNGSAELVVTALAEGNAGARDLAIDLAARLELRHAKSAIVKIFEDKETPVQSRLYAGVALATMGDRRAGGLMRKLALEESPSREYALLNLPGVIGDEAAPAICEFVRRHGSSRSGAPWQAMTSVSARAAVPALLELLREGKPESTNFAIECLGKKIEEAKAAVPDLIRVLDTEPRNERLHSIHQQAAIALRRIGPGAQAALPALIRHAKNDAPDEWERIKDHQPKLEDDHFGGKKYSDNDFIDAICNIRQK